MALAKKKKPLTPLQRLKRTTSKPKLTPLPSLIRKADTAFSRYVRLRDSEYQDGQWVCECITCGRKLVTVYADGRWNPAVNAGHYIGRSRKLLRWTEENVSAQCARCNAWRDKVDMITAYRKALCAKIGEDGVTNLEAQAKIDYKPNRAELLEIIADSTEYVSFTLEHPEGLQ